MVAEVLDEGRRVIRRRDFMLSVPLSAEEGAAFETIRREKKWTKTQVAREALRLFARIHDYPWPESD